MTERERETLRAAARGALAGVLVAVLVWHLARLAALTVEVVNR